MMSGKLQNNNFLECFDDWLADGIRSMRLSPVNAALSATLNGQVEIAKKKENGLEETKQNGPERPIVRAR
jgi:hypothetical protein